MALLKKDTPPAASHDPLAIRESLEDLNHDIQATRASHKKMSDWSSNFLGAAIGLGVLTILTPIKIPLLAAVAVFSLIGYFVTKQIKDTQADSLVEQQKRREELLNEREKALSNPAPIPRPKPKLAEGFGDHAAKPAAPANNDRIEALEKRVKELQDEIEGKPLEKPKTFISRLGFG